MAENGTIPLLEEKEFGLARAINVKFGRPIISMVTVHRSNVLCQKPRISLAQRRSVDNKVDPS